MTETDYAADIPRSVAYAAHAGTSFVPEDRARQEQEGYAATLTADYESLAKLATTDDERATLDAEFARYRDGYKRHYLAHLSGRSGLVSTMIAGPANFPVRRMEKKHESCHRKLEALIEFRKRALDAIRKKLCPELRPIMSGDSDAVERLTADIAQAEQLQARMKAVNAVIRKNLKADQQTKIAALVAIGESEAMARELTTPDCMRSIGFPSY